MKRVLASILAILYLSTSLGASLHLHYCMGKLVSMGLVNHESENCSFCGMSKNSSSSGTRVGKNNCCKDDHKEIRTAGDQKSGQDEYQVQKFSASESPADFHSFQMNDFSSFTGIHHLTHAPPPSGRLPVYLLNCNFRI